ncbi:MAG: glycosyl transferase group 1 [Candidatus Parvarchaeum acidophilus ARMAN-5]|uniref:Glycosyl transferase group 1 n=1 Tax=Candidatus Parvarchaeum acidophilus ARMAN-5 TaxID=662762 RepID=D6GUZ5_PARA5|nr:MAG: glycosyl transferase group 1 [Candidatus Parvarchaeum acidophilus ARMAN-5]
MNKKIKIALFVPWIKSKGGVERTILRILENPLYECDVYTFFYNKKSTFEEFNKYNINVIGKLNSKGFIGKGLGLFLKLLSTKIKGLEEYDIFIVSTAGIAASITIRNKHKKTVALCHTPLRVAHNMYDYYKKELDDLYSRCYATIFLSINEDTGLTPLESLAYGKPVRSVNEGGPKEFIKNGKNGLLVDANERSISNALIRITNSKFYAKLVNGAKNSKRYDEKEFMKNFDEAIETILTR